MLLSGSINDMYNAGADKTHSIHWLVTVDIEVQNELSEKVVIKRAPCRWILCRETFLLFVLAIKTNGILRLNKWRSAYEYAEEIFYTWYGVHMFRDDQQGEFYSYEKFVNFKEVMQRRLRV
jgi:hypothetical protein